jgi:hypothetical protein
MSQAAQLPNTKLGSYSGDNALLPGRTLELDRGRGQGVRDRVPQSLIGRHPSSPAIRAFQVISRKGLHAGPLGAIVYCNCDARRTD